MCLIALAWQAHADCDLVVAANRDEFHRRETESAHWWDAPYRLFAGRDVQAGGAWCGADDRGRFAAVTNVREPDPPGGVDSRGWLVRDYFRDAEQPPSAAQWASRCERSGEQYGPFNLLVADREQLWFVSNRGEVRRRRLAPGVYAISNGHWGDRWPKTERAAAGLAVAIDQRPIPDADLFELMADTDGAALKSLPDTGVGVAREKFLSPVFITSARYGTRASTVIQRDFDGRVAFHERSFDARAQVTGHIDNAWPPAGP